MRYYFRRGRGARIALPGRPESPEFMIAYQAAAETAGPAVNPRVRGEPGSFARLVHDYFASTNYLRLSPSTQRSYQLVIERLLRDENIGHRLVGQMTRQHVQQIVVS